MREHEHAPLAQLDRVFDYESKGRGFESPRARHEKKSKDFFFLILLLKHEQTWKAVSPEWTDETVPVVELWCITEFVKKDKESTDSGKQFIFYLVFTEKRGEARFI